MRIASAAVMLILVRASGASSQMVGIYSDSLASSCNLTIPFPGPSVDMFLVFTPGSLADSMGGASFRVEGLPQGWSGQAFANPNAEHVFGSPFESGASIFFSSCQPGGVVLYRLRLTPSSAVANHELRFVSGPVPLGLSCPWMFSCGDHQSGTALPHARALINSTTTCSPLVIGSCPWTDAPDLLPASTTLSIAPNPPTLKVTIRYSLAPDARFARMSVYDLAGRLVVRILTGAPTPGEGSISWDGRDSAGTAVGAGVYIVRLETDRSSVSRKVVWVR